MLDGIHDITFYRMTELMLSQTLLHLSLIPTIGPIFLKKIADQVIERNIDLYAGTVSDFREMGISEDAALRVVEGLADQALFDQEYALLEKMNIKWTTVLNPEYPALLWHTFAPPPVLYWQGEAVWNIGPTLAVVGSREGTSYGKRALEVILPPCIEQGMIIISGGARGIDTVAHELTLQEGGRTVVVLGSGLLRPYPSSNMGLFKKVVESGGAVVSCFPLQAEGMPWRFPFRNRIISGMSRGCLVAQAATGSGALITARFALDEGRNVYAVPGPFDDPLSAGCHEILQDGAQLVVDAQAILRDYPALKLSREVQTSIVKNVPKQVTKKVIFKEKRDVEGTGLIALCARPISLDELVEKSEKTENELKAELFELQLSGKVQQDFAGLWVKV